MPKNIILCADGTGNQGGTTKDSNVYRVYQAINLHCESSEQPPAVKQISFYDNGVGTDKNKYWKALTGAFGIGFRQNVTDLYTYLARHYQPGDDDQEADRVFLFGFSRGAAEVRALNGMIAAVGLIDGRNMPDAVLKEKVNDTLKKYMVTKPRKTLLEKTDGENHGSIEIEFLGVWDTVSALGFPQKWPTKTVFLQLFSFLFWALDRIVDKFFIFKHLFYNYEITLNVKKACHALAIDDQRLSFHPLVWDENSKEARDTEIHQVWFPGMHSNVGGGYGRTDLSYVALKWMLSHAVASGMVVCDGFLKEVNDKANAAGILHNSRDGLAIFYRYTPRNLTKLSTDERTKKSKLKGEIQIHESGIERMKNRNQWYAPDALPRTFERVETVPPGDASKRGDKSKGTVQLDDDTYNTRHQEIAPVQNRRIVLYSWFLEYVLLLVLLAFAFWNTHAIRKVADWLPPDVVVRFQEAKQDVATTLSPILVWPRPTGFLELIANKLVLGIGELLKFVTPAMFDNFLNFAFTRFPLIGIAIIGLGLVMNYIKNHLRDKDHANLVRLRDAWLTAIEESDLTSSPPSPTTSKSPVAPKNDSCL